MDYLPDLQKQRSHSSISGRRLTAGRRRTVHLASNDGRLIDWKGIWRKILWNKRRIFDSSNVSYDLEAYAQNFDEGAAAAEPDNFSRSFSARFAAAPELLGRIE